MFLLALIVFLIFLAGPELLPWCIQRIDRRNAERRTQFEASLRNPDWKSVEDHYGVPVPPLLKELNAPHLILPRPPSLPDWHIARFLAPPDGCRRHPQHPERFYFATDGGGDHYFINIHQPDSPVWLDTQNPPGIEDVAPSLSDFLRQLRASKPQP